MSEWPKEHAWKACVRQRTEGSNPSLSAIFLAQSLAFSVARCRDSLWFLRFTPFARPRSFPLALHSFAVTVPAAFLALLGWWLYGFLTFCCD